MSSKFTVPLNFKISKTYVRLVLAQESNCWLNRYKGLGEAEVECNFLMA